MAQGGDGGTRKLVTVAGGGRVRECGSGTRAEGSEVERVDKMWSGRWPGLEKGERRVWGHHDTRVVGAERQIKKKKVPMRGNGEGVKGTCWAPAPGVGGYWGYIGVVLGLYKVGKSKAGQMGSHHQCRA